MRPVGKTKRNVGEGRGGHFPVISETARKVGRLDARSAGRASPLPPALKHPEKRRESARWPTCSFYCSRVSCERAPRKSWSEQRARTTWKPKGRCAQWRRGMRNWRGGSRNAFAWQTGCGLRPKPEAADLRDICEGS